MRIIQINNKTEYNRLGNYLTTLNKKLEGPYSHPIGSLVFPLFVWYSDNFTYLAWTDSINTTNRSIKYALPLDAALYPDKYPEFFI